MKINDTFWLTDGTPITVCEVYSNGNFTAKRLDGKKFTLDQSGSSYENLQTYHVWKQSNGSHAFHDDVMGVVFDERVVIEQRAEALGGTVTWTDPVLLRAREIWAKHETYPENAYHSAIMRGEYDTYPVITAIMEALNEPR